MSGALALAERSETGAASQDRDDRVWMTGVEVGLDRGFTGQDTTPAIQRHTTPALKYDFHDIASPGTGGLLNDSSNKSIQLARFKAEAEKAVRDAAPSGVLRAYRDLKQRS